MDKRRQGGLTFITEEPPRKKNLRKFIIAVICCVLVLGSLSTLYMLKATDTDFSTLFARKAKDESDSQGEIKVKNGRTDYLLYCSNDDRSELYFVCVVRTMLPQNEIHVCCISPDSVLDDVGATETLRDVFHTTGWRKLRSEVNDLGDVDFGYTVGATEAGFKTGVNYADGCKVNLSSPIEFHGAYELSLPAGEQVLNGDDTMAYVKYLSSLGDDGLQAMAGVIASVIQSALSSGKDLNASYTYLVNNLDTDMSVVEFSNLINRFRYFAASEETSYILTTDLDTFEEESEERKR